MSKLKVDSYENLKLQIIKVFQENDLEAALIKANKIIEDYVEQTEEE
jgi:hypothetical protein